MECACFPNNGPMMTPEPHMIPGYMGYVPQYKYKFGNTYGAQTNKLFLDPCVNMSPRAVLTDVCPEDCSSTGGPGFYQQATGARYGNCGCKDPFNCNKDTLQASVNPGMKSFSPRFQTIMNHTYAPFCNRFCTKTFEQDQWRDSLFTKEKASLDGWRFCYKSKPWERPERTKPWDGDHAEFRRTQTTLLPPIIKEDIEIGLKGCGCVPPSGRSQPVSSIAYTTPNKKRKVNSCPPCQLYQDYVRNAAKHERNVPGKITRPLFSSPQGRLMEDIYCEDTEVLKSLNKTQMYPAPKHVLENVMEELGEPPILTLHKLQQKLEDRSGKFYADERGLARVCNPYNYSYLTARPHRSNPIYRVCEPVHPTFAGHVPGETFVPGDNRGQVTRNALKYMTYRV